MRIALLFSALLSVFASGQTVPLNGMAPSEAPIIALRNARIVVSSDKVIERGTLLIQGDRILDAGLLVIVPQGTVEIDCDGRTILPAFIESWSSVGTNAPTPSNDHSGRPQLESSNKGAYYWNEAVHPEVRAADQFSIQSKANEALIQMGFGLALTHVQDGIFRGTGALVSLGVEDVSRQLLASDVASFITFDKGLSRQTYPSSQMGSIALIRQAFYDLETYNRSHTSTNLSLEALSAQRRLPFIFQTTDKWEILRMAKIADEFKLSAIYLGSGNEYAALEEIAALKRPVIVPLNFPDAYQVNDPYIVRQMPLSDLKHWELAPSNPFFVKEKGISMVLTSAGVKNPESFWKNLRLAIDRGLSAEDALAALTIEPAKMLNVSDQVGSLENGKRASFTIWSGDPFTEETAVLNESWMLGKRNELKVLQVHDIRGTYNLHIEDMQFPMEFKGDREKPEASIKEVKKVFDRRNNISYDTLLPKVAVALMGEDITLQFNLSDEKLNGSIILHGKVNSRLGIFEGDGMLPDGRWIRWSAIRNGRAAEEKTAEEKKKSTLDGALWHPNMAFGNEKVPEGKTIVFQDATVWTNDKQGIIKGATVFVKDGKITFVGTGNFVIPTGAQVIDAKGLHLTSGIIDEHSHIAISKGVNEGGQAISAEVSISDVVNPDDINIYRQLAGGVTAAQLLHGSANPIGGQSALIKLKWGSTPDDMLIDNAPKFIKFALGENVKQANWGDRSTVRFPQTRMGVEQVYFDAFTRAREYMNSWEAYKKDSVKNAKPGKDIELEVLAEILRSERFITCHSYVQSEVNMFMHVADSMGFKINTFTHILEGYKVADKMAAHGAGGSTFSDWWAYKFEVNDAIPYNAKMMADQGVVVSINSDDAEMGRRLNQEAAKAVKYGGMSEEEAWKMVTLNPAKLLHLDQQMGSVTVGKDADVVLWSDNPLSVNAVVQMTLVDGVVLYDASKESERNVRNQVEKARIISKMLDANKRGESAKPFIKKRRRHYHCDTLGEEGSEEENTH
jgi:imidazolonepropionase-like amidohydrolase